MSGSSMKAYKIEVWVTVICFIIVAVTGGFFSAFIVATYENFFDTVPATPEAIEIIGNPDLEYMFVVKEGMTVLGFPLHYFLLIFLSWIGATVVGAIWCLVMDRLEEQQGI